MKKIKYITLTRCDGLQKEMKLKKILLFLIKKYQKHISPFLSKQCHINCKYFPTCSEYTKQAIEKYGSIKGSYLGIKRIIKCNPFSKGGYDPLK